MTTAQLPPPDTDDMVSVHNVFRDVLSAAPSLVDAPAASDAGRAAMLKNFYENILAFLAVHHQGEDELMFPLLRDRAPEQQEMVQRINAQHHDVDELVAESNAALAAWAPGDTVAAHSVADALARLGDGLSEHLGEEETYILPLAAAHMTLPEWGALPAHGMMHFNGDKVWLILGLIRQRMTQKQRDEMLAHMPPPAVEMWTGFGEAAYLELMSQVGPPLAIPVQRDSTRSSSAANPTSNTAS